MISGLVADIQYEAVFFIELIHLNKKQPVAGIYDWLLA